MTKEQLQSIIGTGQGDAKLITLVDAINKVCTKYEINTKLRLCHFLTQLIHESGTFKYNTEIASGAAYEGRRDLGNIMPGDGIKFKGRGYIQITGRTNYKALSIALGVDFIVNPLLLADNPWNMLSAGWYWNDRKLNFWADKDNINSVTRKINGGLNGLKYRQFWLNKCKEVL
jgi:putative chitinase